MPGAAGIETDDASIRSHWLTAGGTITAGSYADAIGEQEDEEDQYNADEHEAPLISNAGGSDDADEELHGGGIFPKTRHILGLMGFLGFAVVYAMRVNLSVAIVAMVNQTVTPSDNGTTPNKDDTCPRQNQPNITQSKSEGEFAWDEATQGLVLGSFFYGYVLTQVPGGRMAELMGGKRIYGYGVLITAIFTLLTPVAAYWSLPMLVIVRILEGMGEGVTYPAMHTMLAHWIPPLERNKFAAIVYAGSNIGTVISMPLAGWLCSLKFMGGWPLAFYIFGLLGLLWFGCWMWLVYDSPDQHPRISAHERAYIKRCLKGEVVPSYKYCDVDDDEELSNSENGGSLVNSIRERPVNESIPWRSMITSMPLWAILITQCGQGWAFYTQLTELPTYMSNILHYDIEANAILNALPPLTSWLVGIACSALADWMLARRYISLLNSYKLWNTVASIIPSLGLIGVGYVGCNWLWVTFMLAVLGSFSGAIYAGNQMNHIALSPRYAGTMYGITNSAANICGFMAPYVIGSIINHNETLAKWRIVFWLAAAFNIGGNFVYLLCASADEQSWSQSTSTSTST